MKRAFYSFCYKDDNWRVNEVRNIGVITGQQILKPNEWEEVKRKGEDSIKKWINSGIDSSDVVIVLVGENTYKRPWVIYEIDYALSKNKKVCGIYINNLKDSSGSVAKKGLNPFMLASNPNAKYCNVYEPSMHNTFKDIENYIKTI